MIPQLKDLIRAAAELEKAYQETWDSQMRWLNQDEYLRVLSQEEKEKYAYRYCDANERPILLDALTAIVNARTAIVNASGANDESE